MLRGDGSNATEMLPSGSRSSLSDLRSFMSHVVCNCGHVIDTRKVPSKNVYLGISDARWVELTEAVESADHELTPGEVADLLTLDLFGPRERKSFRIYPCRARARLILQGRGMKISLVAESGDVRAWVNAMDEDLMD